MMVGMLFAFVVYTTSFSPPVLHSAHVRLSSRTALFSLDDVKIPVYDLVIDKDQRVDRDKSKKEELKKWAEGKSDIWVVSHGWNTEAPDALKHYNELFREVQKGVVGKEHEYGIIRITWPSKALRLSRNTDDSSRRTSRSFVSSSAEFLKEDIEELIREFPEASEQLNRALTAAKTLSESIVADDDQIMTAAMDEFITSLIDAINKKGDKRDEDYCFDGAKFSSNINSNQAMRSSSAAGGRGLLDRALDAINLFFFHSMMKRAARTGILSLSPD